MTPTQQRRLQALAPGLDRASQLDRVFFEKNPERRHRVRRARVAEVRQFEVLRGYTPSAKLYTVVRQIVPGVRARTFFRGRLRLDLVGEELAARLFQMVQPYARDHGRRH